MQEITNKRSTESASDAPLIIDWAYTGLPDNVPLNPMQVQVDPFKDLFCNKVVAAPTASGKSLVITMCGYKHIMQFKKVLYVGIMKALVEEKRADWQHKDHPWSELKFATVTGDFKWTADQLAECNDADVIVATPEALIARMQSKENHDWLSAVGMIVFDECHLVCADGRGAAYESCIIQFNTAYDAENIALSATIPNSDDFVRWLTVLNGRETQAIVSTYRPVPIESAFFPYTGKNTADSEQERTQIVSSLVAAKPGEQFLVCVWKKSFGRALAEALNATGITAQFHNADLSRSDRLKAETNFKEKRTRVLVSTSTLFTGVNLPARNVILTAATAGPGNDLPWYELQQAAGRAGRPKYDDKGFVTYLLPTKDYSRHVSRLTRGEPVLSRFLIHRELCLAALIEIYMERIWDTDTFVSWYRKSLADQHKKHTDNELRGICNTVVSLLRTYLCIRDTDGVFSTTKRGDIVAQMQLDPQAFGVMAKRIDALGALTRRNDANWISALAENPLYEAWIGHYDKAVVPAWIKRTLVDRYWKVATVMDMRMEGKHAPERFGAENYLVWESMQRYGAALQRLKAETKAFNDIPAEELDILIVRLVKSCGVDRARLYLEPFTVAEQRRLARLGLYSLDDCRNAKHLAAHGLSAKRLIELGLDD